MKFFGPFITGLGIDVSDHHLRLAQVGLFGSVVRLEEVMLHEGLIVDDQVVKPDEFKAIVKEKMASFGFTGRPYRTTVLVPESRVFSHSVLVAPEIKGEEQTARARELAQREIPVPFSQARVCTSLGGKEEGGVCVSVFALENRVLDPLRSAFAQEGLNVIAMEAHTSALWRTRSTYGNQTKNRHTTLALTAIVDVGQSWTTISLYKPTGANVFSRTLPHALAKKGGRAVKQLPEETVDNIIRMIQETMVFFEQKHVPIGSVVLGGVEANDARFKKKMSEGTKIPVLRLSEAVTIRRVSTDQLHVFGSAIGAALRAARHSAHAYQHNFLAR
jgi:Tfp pilus assembly PilM family ATPase